MNHLIFEGAELSGKSWLMSRIYDFLEPKYNSGGQILDGCHWFNCDTGIFGSEKGQPVINAHLEIFNALIDRNILVEKFHLSDKIYSLLYRNEELDYSAAEKKLAELGYKIILTTFPEDRKLIADRLEDRLRLYPHYRRIAKTADWYIELQREYLREMRKTSLPYLIIETEKLPDDCAPKKILDWLGEK